MKTRNKFLVYLLTIMMVLPTWLVVGMTNIQHAKAADEPTTLVEWNFPNNSDDAIADGGIDANLSKTIVANGIKSVTYNNISGGTTSSARAIGWNEGFDLSKNWLVEISTQGYENIQLSSKQRSSNTGPRDFQVQYSIDDERSWNNIGSSIIVANNFTTGVISNLALPSECNDKLSLKIRWVMASNINLYGGSNIVDSSGASRIDDIVVIGEVLPSDLTELTAAIAVAQVKVDLNLPESTTPGDHIVGSRDALIAAIAIASAIDSFASQPVVDAAVVTLNNAITAYDEAIVVPSSDATVTSETYTVSAGGTLAETIKDVPFATPRNIFLSNLIKSDANQTWNFTAIANPVVTGDILVVIAEDETTIVTYTITVQTAEETATDAVIALETAAGEDLTIETNLIVAEALIGPANVAVALVGVGGTRTALEARITAATAIITAARDVFNGIRADLLAAKTEAGLLDPTDYTEESWIALTDALDLPETTNIEIVAKTTAINVAIAGLEELPAPDITNEVVKSVATTSATITWTTDHTATSRVVYDTVSHSPYGSGENYGYAFSSATDSTLVIDHSVAISGLTPGTVYYYRTVSQGSPVGVGGEMIFTTSALAPVVPVVTQTVQKQTITPITPTKAQAAVPAPIPTVEAPAVPAPTGDDQGVIKGDENTTTEAEKVNWTPWIILFVLIILAGAVTGGYFYWFNGEKEVDTVIREKKPENEKQISQNKSNKSKKSKRW